ncbi:MAG: YceI family protein [Candidatus Angelobacter sp.]
MQARFTRLLIVFLAVAMPAALRGQATAPESTITIHVGKSGLFSGFGHTHTVVAPVAQAEIDPARMTATIIVLTRQMKVADKDVSEKDRTQIQADMLGPKVLDAEKFPQIRFTSSRIEQTSPQHYRVSGILELHGVRKELSFAVAGGPQHYTGTTKLKQTDFGIQPFSAGGGTVKVKDQLELAFDIYSRSTGR